MTTEQGAALSAAFERLCQHCEYLLPHPLYRSRIPIDESEPDAPAFIEVMEEAEDEGPVCIGGLRPLTRDGKDCPYFKAEAESPA